MSITSGPASHPKNYPERLAARKRTISFLTLLLSPLIAVAAMAFSSVTVVGFALIGFVSWFFWFKKTKGTRVTVTSSGRQEAMIVVTGGYTPDAVVVQQSKSARPNFRQEETASFSNMVLLPDFDRSAQLATGEIVAVDFVPQEPGKFELACQMGMLHGKLNVE